MAAPPRPPMDPPPHRGQQDRARARTGEDRRQGDRRAPRTSFAATLLAHVLGQLAPPPAAPKPYQPEPTARRGRLRDWRV